MANDIIQPGTGLQGPQGPQGPTGPTGPDGPAGPAGGAVASATEVEVTVTTGQTVLTYTPTASGPFLIGLYLRVITAATTVSAVVTYTDATGAQSQTLQASASLAVGSYPLDSITIDAVAGDAISVVVTAGTANQVYASAAIWGTASGTGGGMTNPMTTLNDLIVGGPSGVPTRLGVGSAGQVLKVLGAAGQAVLFNGSSGYIQVPYVQPALATLSFMVWLLVPSTGIGGQNPAIFDTAGFYTTATGCGLGYNLGAGNTNNGIDFALNATSRVTVTDPSIPAQNTWYCYVATYDGSTMILYRQGANVASASNSGSCVASTTDLLIATSPSRTNRYWGGEIAHVAFFPGVVLTSTEAAALYNNASSMTEAQYESYVEGLSPALYYPLQDSSTTAVNKGTDGSGYNGVYGGGYTQGVIGPVTTPGAPYIGWG